MLDRIENLRRLKEQCERRARVLRVKGDRAAADDMERQAIALGWQVANMQSQAALAAFAARVKG